MSTRPSESASYLILLRRWLWLILLATLLAAGGSLLLTNVQTPVYAATATVLLDNVRSTSNTSQAYTDLLVGERLARTYAEMLAGREVIEAAARSLDQVPDMLEVSTALQRDTTLLLVTVHSEDPEAAAALANHLPAVFSAQQRARQAERYTAIRDSLTSEAENIAHDIAETREALARLQDQGIASGADVTRLNTVLVLQEKSYESLLQSLAGTRLSEAADINLLSVVETAQVPQEPVRPRVFVSVILAALTGAAVGLAVATFLEYMDNTIKRDSDLYRLFGVGTLASVATSKPADASTRSLVRARDYSSAASEAYRMLRTNIRFAVVDEPLRTLLVTSASPGEGKSTTAANLAVIMAQAGTSVILVDADLRRPVQHDTFGLTNMQGLTTALVEHQPDVRLYLRDTDTEGLRLLPSGPVPPNPAELLGSYRMRDLLAQLGSEADIVILDTPPVLAVSESSLLASGANGVILVVRSGVTTIEATRRALEQLEGVQARLLGAVLNGIKSKESGAYSYYSDYHGDGNGRGTNPLSHGRRVLSRLRGIVGERHV